VIEELVQTGLARFEYQNFVYISVASERVTLAMECAADQSGAAFWEFHDRFLVERSDAASAEQLIDFAVELELDEDVFTECYTSAKHQDAIDERTQAARALGVYYGPAVLVNGKRVGITFDAIFAAVVAASIH